MQLETLPEPFGKRGCHNMNAFSPKYPIKFRGSIAVGYCRWPRLSPTPSCLPDFDSEGGEGGKLINHTLTTLIHEYAVQLCSIMHKYPIGASLRLLPVMKNLTAQPPPQDQPYIVMHVSLILSTEPAAWHVFPFIHDL